VSFTFSSTTSVLMIPERLAADEPTGLYDGSGNYQCDVVLLFSARELLDCRNNCLQQGLYRKMAIIPKDVDQAGLAKFFVVSAPGFRDSVRVKHKRVTGSKRHFCNFAVPLCKQSYDHAGRT